MVFRVFCSENSQIRGGHPRCEIEIESWVGEDDRDWSRDSGVVFEDTNNDCCADVAAPARQPVPVVSADYSRRISSENHSQSTSLHTDTSTLGFLYRPISIKPLLDRPRVRVWCQLEPKLHEQTYIQVLSHNQCPRPACPFAWPRASISLHDNPVPSL
jgi:hypothetical protein